MSEKGKTKQLQERNITIIDYGMGNLGSIRNMLKHIGIKAVISSEIMDIQKAEKLILSGVGAFDNGMKNLNDLGLVSVLNEKVINKKTPILGICLGMQLFTKSSEEGELSGLGWLDTVTMKFKNSDGSNKLKIPHMGWNLVNPAKDSPLFNDILDEPRFYFVHSYHLVCVEQKDVLCSTCYGYNFVSGIEKDNIFGVQFHPEKSHKFGMKLLKNFVESA